MKIITTRELLLKTFSSVGQAVSQRPNLPVLSNFLLSASKGILEITATDLETTIIQKTPVKVEKEGKITAPARLLTDFCQTAKDEQILLEVQKDQLLLKAGTSSAQLNTINSEEFPTITSPEASEKTELDKKLFTEAVSSVIFCSSPEEGRPVLTGVLFRSGGGKLLIVATDGYRLAKREIKLQASFEALVPARALSAVLKSLGETEGETVEIALDKEKNQIKFSSKNLSIFTRLLEGAYPNFEQIIPSNFPTTLTVNSKEAVESIKLAALFSKDVGNVVRLESDSKGAHVSGATAQVGEAETHLDGKVTGEPLKIAFNSRFLTEALSAISDKETKLSFSGTTSATLLAPGEKEDLIYVIMPVRSQS